MAGLTGEARGAARTTRTEPRSPRSLAGTGGAGPMPLSAFGRMTVRREASSTSAAIWLSGTPAACTTPRTGGKPRPVGVSTSLARCASVISRLTIWIVTPRASPMARMAAICWAVMASAAPVLARRERPAAHQDDPPRPAFGQPPRHLKPEDAQAACDEVRAVRTALKRRHGRLACRADQPGHQRGSVPERHDVLGPASRAAGRAALGPSRRGRWDPDRQGPPTARDARRAGPARAPTAGHARGPPRACFP